MNPPPYDVYWAKCPSRQALDRIADRWTALIVVLLSKSPHRFGELRRKIDGISQKVLTHTLQSLHQDGLVERRIVTTKPKGTEYSLTALGETLVPPISAIISWAEQHMDSILAARSGKTAGTVRGKRTRSVGH